MFPLTADCFHGVGRSLIWGGNFETRLLAEQTDGKRGVVGLLADEALYEAPEIKTVHFLQRLLILSHCHLELLWTPDTDLYQQYPISFIRGIYNRPTFKSTDQSLKIRQEINLTITNLNACPCLPPVRHPLIGVAEVVSPRLNQFFPILDTDYTRLGICGENKVFSVISASYISIEWLQHVLNVNRKMESLLKIA